MVYTNPSRQQWTAAQSRYPGRQVTIKFHSQFRSQKGPAPRVPCDRESNGLHKLKLNHQQHNDNETMDYYSKSKVLVRYASLSIRRVIVACTDPSVCWSTTLLKFQPFSETSLPHLSHESLYILTADKPPPDLKREGDDRNLYTNLSTSGEDYHEKDDSAKHLSSQEVGDYVTDDLYPYMSEALDYVRSYLESRFWAGVKPKLLLRFGKMLFHSRRNKSNLAQQTPFDGDSLQKFISGDKEQEVSIMKSFDASLSQDFYRKIRGILSKGREEQFVNRERFVIQIEDASNPQVSLLCFCKRSLDYDRKRLTLSKIQISPLRHMVVDVACVGKEYDLRLILTTKQDFSGTPEPIQRIVDRAVYDAKAPGGLYWPLGSTSAGPYRVTGISHLLQSGIEIDGQKWKLRHVNRTSGNEGKGRYTFEMDLIAHEWPKQFKVWRDSYQKQSLKRNCDYTDCQVKPLPTLLGWVWKNCI